MYSKKYLFFMYRQYTKKTILFLLKFCKVFHNMYEPSFKNITSLSCQKILFADQKQNAHWANLCNYCILIAKRNMCKLFASLSESLFFYFLFFYSGPPAGIVITEYYFDKAIKNNERDLARFYTLCMGPNTKEMIWNGISLCNKYYGL